ncbi:MAG: carboxypeptidase-like regulatory domain-containing protein [Bacteroidota bacterium]|nr:carboxypeptidase-like regulatory domain-containing protein [Bacteroidota bacterium]
MAGIKGTLQTERGGVLIGASVVAIHFPTGTRRNTSTNVQGEFVLDALLPGGPYSIQVVPGSAPR